jgi:hypothetical protein
MSQQCEDCAADNGKYSLSNDCCRSRWLAMNARVGRKDGAYKTLVSKYGLDLADIALKLMEAKHGQ